MGRQSKEKTNTSTQNIPGILGSFIEKLQHSGNSMFTIMHGSERQGYCIQLNEEKELFHIVNEEAGLANPHGNYLCR